QAAAVLAQTVPFLPPAVHLAVVDPGVGTSRRAVALQSPQGMLVGPDNGLLLWAAEALGGVTAAVALTNREWFAGSSHTFHGRDIIAPAAAHLAGGAPLRYGEPPVDSATSVRLLVLSSRSGPVMLAALLLTVTCTGH